MNKKIFFLCGLPRAGNTLFSSIMNQNKNISSTGNSPVSEILYRINELKNSETFINFPDIKSLDNVLVNIMNNYYDHWDSEYIIDRSVWGTPYNLELLKILNNNIKIIVLVRDIKEIVASFIRFSYMSDDNYINNNTTTIEDKFDYVYNGELSKWIYAVKNLIQPNNRKYIHLVEYDDLVENTKEEIDKIYKYLDIPIFNHRFNNLNQLENNGITYNDETIIGKGLHTIMTDKVEKRDYNMYDYLPKDLSKYDLRPFWRKVE
jgi:sulfotransferase